MKKTLTWLILSLLISQLVIAGEENLIEGLRVDFVEKEPDNDSVKVRMLLIPEFLRIDSGIDYGDFLLFDRKTKIIWSIVHQDKTILSIESTGAGYSLLPESIKITRTETVLEDVPKVHEGELKQITTLINGKICKKTVVAVNFLPEAVKTMQELNQVLADQYARATLHKSLNDHQTICDTVVLTHEINYDLVQGFPVEVNRINGWSRSLVSFKKDEKLRQSLFILPKNYRQHTLSY